MCICIHRWIYMWWGTTVFYWRLEKAELVEMHPCRVLRTSSRCSKEFLKDKLKGYTEAGNSWDVRKVTGLWGWWSISFKPKQGWKLRGLSLTKLVPEWGRSDSLTTWICIYSFFSSVWHLIIIFWYLLVLSAVPGDCKERWGWLAGGGFFWDPSDSRVDPAMLLKSCGCCWRIPAEVVGVCTVVHVGLPGEGPFYCRT